jgi:hypothetical protein
VFSVSVFIYRRLLYITLNYIKILDFGLVRRRRIFLVVV